MLKPRVSGLEIDFADRNCVVGIEDSGDGVCSVCLAGFVTIDIAGENIVEKNTKEYRCYHCETVEQILKAF